MTSELSDTYKKSKRRSTFTAVVLCAVCLAVNFIFFGIARSLELPLYLDNVGIILAAILGGYLPGIFVGFLTNVVNCISDPSSIYYGIISVLNAVIAAYFAQKGWVTIRKPMKLLLLVVLLAVEGGGFGTLLPWFLDGIHLDSESFANKIIELGITTSIPAAQLLGNLFMDLLDKALTVAIVMIVYTPLPRRLKEMLRFNGWIQRPMSDEEKDKLKHIGCRKISVRTKTMAIIIIALTVMGTAATVISFVLFSGVAMEQHTKLAQGVANVAAGFVDGDSVDRWLAGGRDSAGYAETEKLLYNLQHSNDEIEYVYVYQIREDGYHVVFDLDSEKVKGSPVGSVDPFEADFLDKVPAMLAGEDIEPTVLRGNSYGDVLTVYRQIYDSSGNVAAYAGADVSMEHIDRYNRNFYTGMISLFFAFFIVIFAVVLWVVEYHIVLPVNSMAINTDKFAFNSNESLEQSVDNLRRLDIQTGDEIENLYGAIVKMAGDSVEHLEDIRNKNETIVKMQNALILVLADMVESRDKNTGDHVRKTAAYARAIMRKMKELGFYPDQLTDKFIADVSNSAPLHDVGKIKVSDVILNKPGRLTDEEFVIMQSHTKIGGEIIDQVISLVPEPDYLNEAKNLATYHHEKWNGKGYPEGRAGEDIPLSARIMAVADVFDALVSRRSYKEPFSFEQACDIIRESSGTHFDPKVAEAFLAAEEECRAIAASFGDALVKDYVEDNHVDDSGKAR